MRQENQLENKLNKVEDIRFNFGCFMYGSVAKYAGILGGAYAISHVDIMEKLSPGNVGNAALAFFSWMIYTHGQVMQVPRGLCWPSDGR